MFAVVTRRTPREARAGRLARKAVTELERFFKRIILVERVFEEDAGQTIVRGITRGADTTAPRPGALR